MSRIKPHGIYISYTLLFLVSIIIILGFVYMGYYNIKYTNNVEFQTLQPIQTIQPIPISNVQVISENSRYARAPKPERDWATGPDISVFSSRTNIPSIPTRGIPETYQQMGILRTDNGNTLPLYGRRTSRSDRFQYYSRTDSYNPVQLPVQYNNYDCVDDIGCSELFNGDVVSLVPTGEKASVTLYRLSGPTYR